MSTSHPAPKPPPPAIEPALDQAFLLETSRQFASSHDIQSVMDRLSEKILEVVPASRSGILLIDEDGEHILLAAEHASGLESDGEPAPRLLELNHYPEILHVQRSRRPLLIDDVRRSPLMGPVMGQVSTTDLRSLLCVPLLAGEEFMGVLSIGRFGEPLAFDPREVDLCQTIANQAAVALENARLYEELCRLNKELEGKVERRTGRLRRSLRQMGVINEIAHLVAGTLEPGVVASTAAERLREGFDLYASVVAFLNDDGRGFRIAAASCRNQTHARHLYELEQRLDEGICGYVATRGEAYLTGNTGADPYYLPTLLEGTRSELCVPLRSGSRVVGVLDVQSDRRNAFDEEDQVALEALADTLVAAVRTAEAFAETREAHAFTETVIQNLTGGLIVTDRHGSVRQANLRACQILGVEREEIEGRDLLEVFPDAGALFIFDPNNAGREVTIRRGDGEWVPIGYSNSFFASRDGEMEAVLISFQDLSEVKALQKQVQHRERLATIGEVAAAVAHEVRNPLFGITSTAQILARELGEGTAERDLVEGLLKETRRLDSLVEQLLMYGRPTAPVKKDGDLAALLREVLDIQEGVAATKGIDLRVHLSGPVRARFDADQVKAALLNLINNAMDAASGRIFLRVEEGEQEAVIEVSDDGPGIPPEQRETVFELYFTTKGNSGSGMGLALSRKVARDHGGDVVCRPNPAGGATFRMTLPRNGCQED